ncbi:hypothetical protein EHQ58_13560 [Leptospira ognonensis]|uniref:NAD glycohydrolase translocation F5/8 type C domain-containing protein n=1 Tax=Leptospira ognonensis TaxID=2484945 RepID=A0A4R9K072_9LEPT|nr:hypothetical protein [Leptospira ognonensis]TGL57318.1 hypothetical protein EHQ58_13560 [Leptospira ognonensis]
MTRLPFLLFISFLFFLGFSSCGPKAEKAFTYKSMTAVGQLQPDQPWRYSPEFTLDGKASTAYCADSKVSDAGFTVYLGSYSEFSAIQVTNGFAKSATDASQNSQIKKMKITALDVSINDNKTKVNSEKSLTVELKPVSFAGNSPTEQFLELDNKLVGNVIRLEFLDSYKGSKFKDICLSEFSFGSVGNGKFQKFPLTNEEKIKSVIAGFEEASRHYFAFKKLITLNEAGSINFYNQNLVLPVFFKSDFTFSFSEIYGADPAAGSGGIEPAKQGSYTILASTPYGIEINLSYFDSGGMERNDTWVFKRAVSGDEDFDYFKTKLGTSFSEVFDPKSNYLLFLKDASTGASYYNYEIPLK